MEHSRPPIGLRYFAPSTMLRRVVSSYYVFHANLPYVADQMRADLAQIRFVLSGSAVYLIEGRASQPAPPVALIGPTFMPMGFEATGPALVVGVGLQAAGWAALVQEDASEYVHRVTDATGLFGNCILSTLDALFCAKSTEERIDILDGAMCELFSRANEPPHWFTTLTDAWLTHSSSPEIDRLIRAAELSGRQVERLTRRIYGASPKLLARKYRALKAASKLGRGEGDWHEIAGDDFYDQSHFIREIKQFVGSTPTQIIKSPSPLTSLTRQRRLLLGKIPTLTSIT